MTAMAPRPGDGTDLDTAAATFAGRDVEEAEMAIAALAAEAIRGWRLDEAMFWQRVKFRARMLRAMRGGVSQRRTEGGTRRC